MANLHLQISLYLVSLIILSNTHLTFSFNHDHPFLPQSTPEDFHDLLPLYGFPRGLLPDKVESYTLASDGSFKVKLSSPCNVQFDDLVYYDKTISGVLTYGSISDLVGIQARKFFLWVPVTGIDAASGYIQFHVGALSETLPAEQFENIHACKSKPASFGANAELIM